MRFTKILFLFVFCLPLIAAAQDDERHVYNADVTFYAGGFLGDSFIFRPPQLLSEPPVSTLDDDFIGGFRLAYHLNNFLAMEGSLGFTPASIFSATNVNGGVTSFATIKVDTYVFSANLVGNLIDRGPIRPFLTGGVSAVHFDFRDSPFLFTFNPSETDFAFNAGGGLRIPFRETMSFRFDGRYYWLNPEFSEDDPRFVELSGGVQIDFDF
ncbi:MAG TPA: outer membrane beta-barrel protein [Acidobacteriota bacterium]|nr:outer membrane beta-barrel protein [Acidobacteriota bacterium]